MVLLSHLVEAFHSLRLAGDVQILAPGEQKLLVDQVAKQVVLLFVELLLGPLLLLGLGIEILIGAFKVRPADHLVVYPRNDVLYEGSLVRRLWLRNGGRLGRLAKGNGHDRYRQAGNESGTVQRDSKGHLSNISMAQPEAGFGVSLYWSNSRRRRCSHSNHSCGTNTSGGHVRNSAPLSDEPSRTRWRRSLAGLNVGKATRKADQTDGMRAVHLRQFGYPADVILV